jgi:mannose-6-phosphate isomerase-like protein (cupin superfamily)
VKTSLPALCALAISLALPARAAPVPVEGAPYHRLVFSNDDLAVIETIVPPGGDSGFHRHSHELFYVVIAPAKVSTQRLGRELRAAPPLVPGSVGMNAMSDEPFIHRIVNPDKTAYHVVAVELRRNAPLGRPVNDRPGASGFVQVQDHPRLRAWRLVLEPGQSAPAFDYSGIGGRIFIRGGELTVTSDGQLDQALVVAPGDFEQLRTGAAIGLRNSGRTTIELIDVELK